MIRIETLQTAGIKHAIHAMRNPYSSWQKSDSKDGVIGEADSSLSIALSERGSEHDKHLRMIVVWAEIKAPRYWWTQFDTYRFGVEKVSTSTMHTLMKAPLTQEDFSGYVFPGIIDDINSTMLQYKKSTDSRQKQYYWQAVINNLPQSFLQERTVMMSYAALKAMYKQREGHKLGEWAEFRRWIEGLPESWMITGDKHD